MTEPLVQNPYWRVYYDPAQRFVRVERTSKPLPETVEDLDFAEMDRKLAHVDRSRTALLLDMRAAPLRNDPAFERANAERNRWTMAFVKNFEKKAMLLKSAVGMLQVSRLQRERGNGVPAFLDEAEALAHLGIGHARAS